MAIRKSGLAPLSSEEQSRAYAKYYRNPVPPDPAHLAMMDSPCDPSLAIFPEQINDLLNPGDLQVEIGWCNLSNGAGFIANRNIYRSVTAEMIDQWWVNMEKGYPLWEPDDHKSFVWEVPPPVGGYLGAIQIAEEKMGPMPPMKIRIRWDDSDTCPIPRIYEHAIVASGINAEGEVQAMILHEYEESPRGTRMRSTMRFLGPVPPGLAEIWKKHDRAEVSTFPGFLPDLYRMWQTVKDPAINRQCSLKKRKST